MHFCAFYNKNFNHFFLQNDDIKLNNNHGMLAYVKIRQNSKEFTVK